MENLKTKAFRRLIPNNVNEFYQKNFSRFLFDNSNEVNIDDKVYSNTDTEHDKFRKFCLAYLPNEKGEPNFNEIVTNNKIGGFELTEIDFIESELEFVKTLKSTSILEKKQIKFYKEYLENRLSELNKPNETVNHFDSIRPLLEHDKEFIKFVVEAIRKVSDSHSLNTEILQQYDILKKDHYTETEIFNGYKKAINFLKDKFDKKHTPLNLYTLELLPTMGIGSINYDELEFIEHELKKIEQPQQEITSNKLSIAEQQEVLNIIQIEFIEFFQKTKATPKEQHNFIENQITGMLVSFQDRPRTDFFIERLRRLKASIIDTSNTNDFAKIDNTFTVLKEEIFNILNSEPINLDTLEQDVRTFTVNAKDFISKYHKIALNDALLMVELKQKINDLKIIIKQLITVTIMNETPKKHLSFQGINASKFLVSFILSTTELFTKDSTTSKEPQQETKTVTPPPKKNIFDFIFLVDEKENFLSEIKNTFPTEIGISIKAIINKLSEEKILIIGAREFKTIFNLLTIYFQRNIGTYNSIQNVKDIDKTVTDSIHQKLEPLIIKYKTKQ